MKDDENLEKTVRWIPLSALFMNLLGFLAFSSWKDCFRNKANELGTLRLSSLTISLLDLDWPEDLMSSGGMLFFESVAYALDTLYVEVDWNLNA